MRIVGHILVYFLIAALSLPSVVKLSHHHEEAECRVTHDADIHKHHDACELCQFEFSVFISSVSYRVHLVRFLSPVHECLFVKFVTLSSHYSFLLRAPPSLAFM